MAGHPHTTESKLKLSNSMKGKGHKPIPIGSRFGMLTIISGPHRSGKYNHYKVTCRCDCGVVREIEQTNLRQNHTKSCGCLWRNTVSGHNRLESGESSFRTLYRNYRERAKSKGLEFSLSPIEFKHIVVQDCHYCGQEAQQRINSKYAGHFIYNGIDRKDNDKGYTIENSVACCKSCNTMKRNMSYDEFIQYFLKLYHHWGYLYVGVIVCVEDEERV